MSAMTSYMSYPWRYVCSRFISSINTLLFLIGIHILLVVPMQSKLFQKESSTDDGIFSLNISFSVKPLTQCAICCSKNSLQCEAFFYNQSTGYCLLGGGLFQNGTKPSPGTLFYSTRKLYCDTNLGYSLKTTTNSSLCFILINTSANYQSASSDCRVKHGRLVTMKTQERKALVVQGMETNNVSSIWIGLNDIAVESQFVWSDGTYLTSSEKSWLFLTGQPDNSGDEDCADFINLPAVRGRGVSDWGCKYILPFMCEYLP